MTAILMILLVVLFVVADVLVRAATRRMTAARERREREAVLTSALQLSFAA